MTGDCLHPPMVDDEDMWRDGRWQDGAREHVRQAARLVNVKKGDRVLDVGCGVGGPARLLADEYGAYVFGTSISKTQVATAPDESINRTHFGKNILLMHVMIAQSRFLEVVLILFGA